jgi:hypothetical protein
MSAAEPTRGLQAFCDPNPRPAMPARIHPDSGEAASPGLPHGARRTRTGSGGRLESGGSKLRRRVLVSGDDQCPSCAKRRAVRAVGVVASREGTPATGRVMWNAVTRREDAAAGGRRVLGVDGQSSTGPFGPFGHWGPCMTRAAVPVRTTPHWPCLARTAQRASLVERSGSDHEPGSRRRGER